MKVFFGFLLLLLASFTSVFSQQKKPLVLKPELMKANINYFNSLDSEDVKNYVSNADSYQWLSDNIPLFDCPDSAIQNLLLPLVDFPQTFKANSQRLYFYRVYHKDESWWKI